MIAAIYLLLVAVAGWAIYFIMLNSKKEYRIKAQIKAKKKYLRMYEVLACIPIFNRYLNKIYTNLSMFGVYNRDELRFNSAKQAYMITILSALSVVGAMFLYPDFISRIIAVIAVFVIFDVMLDRQINKIKHKMYIEFKQLLSDMRQEYLRTFSIVESLESIKLLNFLKRPVNELINILTSPDAERNLQEFMKTPFKPMQIFANICYITNEMGDTADHENLGESGFLQALQMLAGFVNSEIYKFTALTKKFGKAWLVTLIPLAVIPMLQFFFIKIIPGLALVYGGPIGYISRAVTLLITVVCFTSVSRKAMDESFKEDDRSIFFNKLLEKEFVKKFLEGVVPKGYKRAKIQKKLNYCLSKMSIEELYLKKVVIALVLFIFAAVTTTTSVYVGRNYLINTTSSLSLIPVQEDPSIDEKKRLELDMKYLQEGDDWTDERLRQEIKKYFPSLANLKLEDEVNRMKSKKMFVKMSTFKWWFSIIWVLVAVLGWFIPNIQLRSRRKLAEQEAYDEYMQYQVLIGIFSGTQLDAIGVIQQLASQAKVFKYPLTRCYLNITSNPEVELEKLKTFINLKDFHGFIDKLKLVFDNLSLKEAFSDLVIERDLLLKLRELNIDEMIEKRKLSVSMVSLVPILIALGTMIIVPIGVLAFSEMMRLFNTMQF